MSDSLLSGNISFAGLGSGTDFSTLIEGLMKVEQRRITKLEEWRKSWDDKIVEFQDLNTKLLSLKTSLETINTPGKFLVKNAASSSESVASATAGPDTLEGSYTVEVTQTATNHIMTSDRDSDGLLGVDAAVIPDANTFDITGGTGGTFTFTYGGNTVNISLGVGATLNDLVNAINAHPDNKSSTSSGIGVRASTFKIAEGDYRLQLTGLDLGNDPDHLITVTGSTLVDGLRTTNFGDDADWPEYNQLPQDALFKFNGISLTRQTNSIDDVAPGLTLLLKDSGTTTITVKTDAEAIKENVIAFVDAVNEVRTKINEISKVDTTTNEGSILTGNYGVDMIGQNLKNIVASKGIGFDYDDDFYSALSQIGILTDAEEGSVTRGLLVLDEAKLDEALANDPDAVAKLFSANYSGETDQPTFSYLSCLPGTTEAGTYDVRWDQATQTGTIGGYAATYNAATKELTANSGAPVSGLVVRINDPLADITTGVVRIKLGKTNELIDEIRVLTDPKSSPTDFEAGPLAVLEENYNDIIKSIDSKIEFEERRITRLQRQYKDRFARLDAMLGYYNNIASGMQSQILSMMQQS
ncbi:flagellar filament capping protein FliD [Desulfocurvibacter africanus]|uniref:Flagellar hook-associated protein 2 n=2 Tax=Desulfocurvibacter africanus TaxID=873 RepID=M5PX33_DESAF|nr:flagellar filament capping protein FliD [Desulfocurvibacter africanus]EMG38530.1 flagellar capping protein [Desulfocurvibacter africanus PCS]